MSDLKKITIQYLETAVGELLLGVYQQRLCLCDWRYRNKREAIDARLQRGLNARYQEGCDELLLRAREQLQQYFYQQRKTFSLPLCLVGTEFQRQVWHGLQQIPYGATWSYLQLAQSLGRVNSVRAVASANGGNALSIFIPCHRVIGSRGELTGYAGGIDAKRKLIRLEGDLFGAGGEGWVDRQQLDQA